jgi:hypothetical protein
VKKVKFAFLATIIISAFVIQPMAISQAGGPLASVSSLNTHLLGSNSSSFGHLTNGSPLQHNAHGGGYYPTREKAASGTPAPLGTGAVTYHADGTIIDRPNVYVIWYGNWDQNSCSASSGTSTTPSIIEDLLRNIGESDWNGINTTYFQKIHGEKTYVQPSITYSGCAVDSGSQGFSLDAYDAAFTPIGPQVSDVVNNALLSKKLPSDPNGVYFVLTSKEVSVADFLTQFCAYHSSFIGSTSTIKYAFIGDASKALRTCAAQVAGSPNNNPVADAMVSLVAHELVEAVSDPEGVSWYDQAGFENADKCAWTFGAATKSENGSFYNMSFGEREYLIQQNVAANTNTCISALHEKSSHGQSHSEGESEKALQA